MSLVLDASMTITWLFQDECTEAAHIILRMVAIDGAEVPSHWRLEVANVLRNAARRGRCDAAYADRSLQRLARLPITIDDQTNRQAWGSTRDLSAIENLTLYDAAYLELAVRKSLPIASRDIDLINAAKRHNLGSRLITPTRRPLPRGRLMRQN